VRGWYGTFTFDKLKTEIIPKLTECAIRGRHFPFLIARYRLENKAKVNVTEGVPNNNVKSGDVNFSPRTRFSAMDWVAIALSPTKYIDLTSARTAHIFLPPNKGNEKGPGVKGKFDISLQWNSSMVWLANRDDGILLVFTHADTGGSIVKELTKFMPIEVGNDLNAIWDKCI